MNKNSIVFITQYFPPEMGAPQSRIYETAIGLKKMGWDVLIVTAMPNYPTGQIFKGYAGRYYSLEIIEEIHVHRYWLYPSKSKKPIPRILNMLSFSLTVLGSWVPIRKFKPMYILAESPPLLLGLSALLLSKLSGCRFILNVSDLWPLSASELGAIRSDTALYKLLEKLEIFLYKNAFACTGQSNEIISHLNSKGAEKAWLYRNGVDISRFKFSKAKSYKKPLKIVYAGLLGVAQGILDICKNLNLDTSTFEFHIYGTGVEREAIETYLKTSVKPIFLYKPIQRDNIPNILTHYDLTIIPLKKAIYGAVPSKIYEAMAAGLPILFTGGGEGAEIIKDNNLGWICEPSDYVAIQNTLQQISTITQQEFQNIQDNCLNAAKKIYSREIQINNLHKKLISN
jgi:glycosyltransferase involved in cell wall biosynthesis